MVVRIIQMVCLMIGVAILDRSLIVEAARKRGNVDSTLEPAEHRSAVESSISRFPPDIVVPLPFVYPEYVDPREQIRSAAVTDLPRTKQIQTTEQSLGSAILENVRSTMIVSSAPEVSEPHATRIVNEEKSTQSTRGTANRHSSSSKRVESYENPTSAAAAIDAKPIITSEDASETDRPIKSSLKFGARLRPSYVPRRKEVSPKPTNCTNESADSDDSSNKDLEGNCQSQSMQSSSRRIPNNRTRADGATRRRPGSAYRQTSPRRRRPNVSNSKEIAVDADVTQPKSLAGRVLRRKPQSESLEVKNNQE